MTNALRTAPSALEGTVTVSRRAIQALAEWAYFPFTWERISAKLPPKNPRFQSHTFADDVHSSLQRDRMAFLKELFWKAEQEASRRERAVDSARGLGEHPALETFMECVAEMDDLRWDEPLTPKALAERRKKVRAELAAKAAEQEVMDKWKRDMEDNSPERLAKCVRTLCRSALDPIRQGLEMEHELVREAAKDEARRLLTDLQELVSEMDETLATA